MCLLASDDFRPFLYVHMLRRCCTVIMEHANATLIVDTLNDLFLIKYTCHVSGVDHGAR